MIQVHHLNNSRSHRVLWLLEELDVPYEVIPYQRDPATMLAPPTLKQIHPLGKSPVIQDGAEVIAESGAILEYLLRRHGGGRFQPGAAGIDETRFLHWFHFAEGSAMPPLLLKLYFSRVVSAPPAVLARIDSQIGEQLDYMEQALAQTAYFAGSEFSAADIQMSFPLFAATARGGLNESRPTLWKYLEKIQQRPAFLRANERGGALRLG